MRKHRHRWAPASPIAPTWDKGNRRAREVAADPKLQHFGCDCSAVKSVLSTNKRANLYVSRPTPHGRRLWRGRR